MSWVFSAFLLASTVTVPVYGKLSDLYGRKVIFVLGNLVMLTGSVLCALSDSMVQLIVFRAIQGLGAGGIMAVATTIIGDIFTVEERGKMQGWFSAVWGVSAIIGPLLGGLIIQFLSWPWVFYINVPIALIAVLVLILALHENIEKKKHKIDYIGSITLTVSMTALLLALLNGGSKYAWLSAPIISLFVIAVLSFIWFLLNERKAAEPMMPLDLFKTKTMAVSSLASLLVGAVLMGVNSYMPSYVQGVLGGSATEAGTVLTPLSIGWPLATIFGGRRMVQWGFRKTALIGMVMIAVTSVLLYFTSEGTGVWYPGAVLFFMGGGMGLVTLAFVVAVQSSVSWNRRGVATASLQFIRSLGSAVGVAVMGAVMNAQIVRLLSQDPEIHDPLDTANVLLDPVKRNDLPSQLVQELIRAFDQGLHHAFLLLGVFGIIGLLVTLYFPRRIEQSAE